MKRVLLSFLVLLGFTTAKAQLNNGCKAQNFTFTALNNGGQLVDLYAWLDSNYYVILDVSATWCGPCWNYHNTHALKDLYNTYGPGTPQNKVRVVYVEGDGTTTDAHMAGAAGSQGDWLAGTPYPMCNPAQAQATAFDQDYEIGYFPTIYLICPDRTVKEVGQLTTAQLWAEVSPTPQCAAKINVDATPVSATGKLISCNGNYSLDITIKNRGFNNLTSATINAKNGANVVASTPWTGNLATYQTASTLFNINGAGSYDSLEIEVVATGDQITANDKFTVYIDNYTAANAATMPNTENMDGGTSMPKKIGFESVASLSMFGFYDGVNGATKLKGVDGNNTKGVFVNFYNQPSGATGTLVLGNYNTTTPSTYVYLDFDVAYAQYTAAQPENDKLEIMLSTDCGNTWNSVWNKAGNNLKTTAPQTTGFIPNAASQWAHHTVDISSIKNNTNALVAVKATSDYGNYAWIDNIKVAASSTPLSLNEVNQNTLDIYPNPASSVINLRGLYGNAVISLTDMMGRTIKTESFDNINNEVSVHINNIAEGNYFLKIVQDGNTVTKPVSVRK